MAAGVGTKAGWVLPLLALGAVTFAVVVSGTAVVQGPLAEAPAGVALVAATAAALAAATAVVSLLPTGADFEWRADGPVCLGLLVALSGGIAAGWEAGPDQLRSAGSVAAPLAVPLLGALVERRARATQRWSVLAAVVVIMLSLARYAVRDPFQDAGCWADCSLREVAPLASRDATSAVEVALGVAAVTIAGLAVGWAILLTARTRHRRSLQLRLVLAAALSASATALSWTIASVLADRELAARLIAVYLILQCLTAALVAAPPLLALRRRRELRGLATALGEQPRLGTLEATLSRILRDQDLQVAYWLPRSGRYVDAHGNPVNDAVARPSITLERDGEPMARVLVSRVERELEAVVGSAARLAIDSERLQAEVRTQLADLIAARQRIVTAADDVRRSAERTIHDEVQSELVGALLELAHHRSRAAASGDVSAVAEVDAISAEVRELVARLREFSRGIYPVVLDSSGLPAALEALAEEAPTPLRVNCTGSGSAPIEAQRAAYLLVLEAVAHATHPLDVSVKLAAGVLELTIGGHPGDVTLDLRDRTGALGGSISIERDGLRAVMPCE
jgi:signal transduction histidine kinase